MLEQTEPGEGCAWPRLCMHLMAKASLQHMSLAHMPETVRAGREETGCSEPQFALVVQVPVLQSLPVPCGCWLNSAAV